MKRIHQRLLEGGRVATVQEPRPIAGIQLATLPTTYVRFGIRPELAKATHNALHQMAERLASQQQNDPSAVFADLVQTLQNMGRPRKRSVALVHFLGLAAHYGIMFRTLGDLQGAVNALHLMVAPAIEAMPMDLQRERYWTTCGDLFALLGEGVIASPISRELQGGLSADVIVCVMQILSSQKGPIPGSRLLWLSVLCDREDLDPTKLGQLAHQHTQRTDDIIELLRRKLLSDAALMELLQHPELMGALSLEALDELLTVWDPSDGPLLDTARAVASDLIETNIRSELGEQEPQTEEYEEEEGDPESEPEPEPEEIQSGHSAPFDHTRLDIAEPVGRRTGHALQAVQIVLVHGVIQPGQSQSSMINGSEISRDELDELCMPHLTRAKIAPDVYEKAVGFLTTIRVLQTITRGGRKRTRPIRRVRFMREVTRNPRGVAIAKCVLALNKELRG